MLGSKGWLSQPGKEVRRSSAKVRCHGIQSQMMKHVCLKSRADAGVGWEWGGGGMPDAGQHKVKVISKLKS